MVNRFKNILVSRKRAKIFDLLADEFPSRRYAVAGFPRYNVFEVFVRSELQNSILDFGEIIHTRHVHTRHIR